MEIEATYIAKDGMRFNDPMECERYEKGLGVLKGSVGSMIERLKEFDGKQYVFGTVVVRNGNKTAIYTRVTRCVDDVLGSFVNISDLTEEQRYLTFTVDGMIETFTRLDKDLPCQYMISTSPRIDFSSDITVIANYNEEVWKDEK